jgi:hypothetical protein
VSWEEHVVLDARTLKVVLEVRVPVGKSKSRPLPKTLLPILIFEKLSLSWYVMPASDEVIRIKVLEPLHTLPANDATDKPALIVPPTFTVAVFVNCTAAQEPDALEASTLNVVVDASAAV